MSYNIDRIKGNFFNAKISATVLNNLLSYLEDSLPEQCFLRTLKRKCQPDEQGYYSITNMSWCGSYSGRSYDLFINKVLPQIEGKMELFLIWEDGESIEGLRVENGTVTKCDVGFVLL